MDNKINGLYYGALHEPHLLIAGTTGSGKSVIINGLIYTLLHYGPETNQLILIDPKRVELIDYKDCQHTIAYASEADTMVNALKYAMQIVEDRFKVMQRMHVKEYPGSHIYIIIDEYADLITTNKKDVEPLIRRIGQIGRASRVHLIIATQTPIRDIINTTIKVNIDCRFALRTRSKQDSINILGVSGAEKLPKYGQAFYMSPSGLELYNIPMISETELKACAAYWKRKPTIKGLFKRIFK